MVPEFIHVLADLDAIITEEWTTIVYICMHPQKIFRVHLAMS